MLLNIPLFNFLSVEMNFFLCLKNGMDTARDTHGLVAGRALTEQKLMYYKF